jgi:hypothetical protein
MAARLGVDPQGLQQFISDSPWEAEELWRSIRREVIPSQGALEAWIVDETGWIKQGHHSVGVSHQYCGSVGSRPTVRCASRWWSVTARSRRRPAGNSICRRVGPMMPNAAGAPEFLTTLSLPPSPRSRRHVEQYFHGEKTDINRVPSLLRDKV